MLFGIDFLPPSVGMQKFRTRPTSSLAGVIQARKLQLSGSQKGATEIMRPQPSEKQEAANMNDTLAQLRHSGRIHFVKSLPQTAVQRELAWSVAELTLPAHFIRENADKVEQRLILRARSSRGKGSRRWLVKLCVSKTVTVRIRNGWVAFVAGNRLRKDDSLIFLLEEGSRSEFEVLMFRGPSGSPYFPDEGDYSTTDDDEGEYVSHSDSPENYNLLRFPSPGHRQGELNSSFISNFRNGEGALVVPHTEHFEARSTYPGFRKRLTASDVGSSSGSSCQFAFPWSFVKTHGNQLQVSVELQGIHERSPTYFITCRRRPGNSLRVEFLGSEWKRFVGATA